MHYLSRYKCDGTIMADILLRGACSISYTTSLVVTRIGLKYGRVYRVSDPAVA